MLKFVSIFLITYYTLGSTLLPLGDFSRLVDLPEMYRHCKNTEDKDMTFVDFITDHLIDIDGLFDKHDHGDKQKPHTPLNFHPQQIQASFYKPYIADMNSMVFEVTKDYIPFIVNEVSFCHHNRIFRPPISS